MPRFVDPLARPHALWAEYAPRIEIDAVQLQQLRAIGCGAP